MTRARSLALTEFTASPGKASEGMDPSAISANTGGSDETLARHRSVALCRRRLADRHIRKDAHHDMGGIARPAYGAEEPGRRAASVPLRSLALLILADLAVIAWLVWLNVIPGA